MGIIKLSRVHCIMSTTEWSVQQGRSNRTRRPYPHRRPARKDGGFRHYVYLHNNVVYWDIPDDANEETTAFSVFFPFRLTSNNPTNVVYLEPFNGENNELVGFRATADEQAKYSVKLMPKPFRRAPITPREAAYQELAWNVHQLRVVENKIKKSSNTEELKLAKSQSEQKVASSRQTLKTLNLS